MARIGDSVWLPYSHMANARTGEAKFSRSALDDFIPAAAFTAEEVVRICDGRPYAVFGGEIRSYQKESVPKFVAHMQEEFPDLLAEAASLSGRIRQVIASLTNVGRPALLKTLLPNVGEFTESSRKWTWDGERFTATEPSGAFMQGIAGTVSTLPSYDASVKVTDDAQVGPNTVFLD